MSHSLSSEALTLMCPRNLVLLEQECRRLKSILARVLQDLGADLILLIDKSGQAVVAEGHLLGIDQTALASLAAANIAATNALARVVGEPEFSILQHQGRRRSIHIFDVAKRFSLVVIVGERVFPGVVRWKMKRAAASLDQLLEELLESPTVPSDPVPSAPMAASSRLFSDEDINQLFGEIRLKPKIERKVQR
jgi:predicted regulator of Ras-like GTPase activity (Roadblock/LC7/MglB family)